MSGATSFVIDLIKNICIQRVVCIIQFKLHETWVLLYNYNQTVSFLLNFIQSKYQTMLHYRINFEHTPFGIMFKNYVLVVSL